ncbi:MAG TPA: hypothetical protein DDW94_07205 [Deltaproteobacteria bacterium]|nr:MAG: hypothetical protein A2Z79_01735 [Deltaproteobacteria bacterium GWA2_55_82]OGQ62554.1 MAG: hypothetical protein A3I81_08545 [Deltaproteobacteria bacterium RIFCSPLOWO2_02_FULL_55_12]OIJ74144.1 MAG: hypothetical protein A2V21_307640 [Deltaproteobacteria bacterium GWC2_55_46]HBG46762.1 hypothetical protein [Deltaproteobacteria bacterium]HCY11229.1 hypothetical protein [Deltaproteobacteria bacterium]
MDKKDKDSKGQAAIDVRQEARTSRRGFLRKAIVTGVAVTATAGLAKKTSDLLLKEDCQKAYLDDVLPGDKVLAARSYVVMTKEEKDALVERMIQFHKNPEA